jgi:N-acetylneuraminic acid mutarotase
MGGSARIGAAGSYGTQGTPSTKNVPGARYGGVSWGDSAGNFWLFGGQGIDSAGHQYFLNDLWQYSPSAKAWTWVSGSNVGNAPGIYGTMGVASASVVPGARFGVYSWMDTRGNFWLFGGYGADSTGTLGELGDLWEYSPSANTWTWVSGSNLANAPAVYGTKGTASTSNSPGARGGVSSWVDAQGNFWLFGGFGSVSSVEFNDLWEYSPGANTWTWVSGSNVGNAIGNYGTQGTASTNNAPGARGNASAWVDSAGNFWLLGGVGLDSTGVLGELNDLWQYSSGANTWTWMSGARAANADGIYGMQGTPSTGNTPGARYGAISWIDAGGNLWLFGGAVSAVVLFNDLWKYNPSAKTWTWVSGSNVANAQGFYGNQGVPSTNNAPGARTGAVSWIDSGGHIWLLGGLGSDSTKTAGLMNDLWEYSP